MQDVLLQKSLHQKKLNAIMYPRLHSILERNLLRWEKNFKNHI